MISQQHITPETPMGATLVPDGATFRSWAPRARQVFVNGRFGGTPMRGELPELLMAQHPDGYWTGFIPGARDGDLYKFLVVGEGGTGFKPDPYGSNILVGQTANLLRQVIYQGLREDKPRGLVPHPKPSAE
jgi:1,4-alpha-glucan branching enzyme